MRTKIFFFFALLMILNESKAQLTTVFSQKLTGSSYNFYNMGYTIDEINDVIYDQETDQILLAGRASDEANDYSPAVPWIAYTRNRAVEEKRNLPASLFRSKFIKNEKAYGLSVYRLIKFSNNSYGLNGGIISIIHPGKWSAFETNTFFPFNTGDYTHGFFEVDTNRYVPGYFYDKTRKFGIQMFDKNLNPTDAAGKKMGTLSFPNKKNIAFHMCTKADPSGYHYSFSTQANFDEHKVKVYLHKFKFETNVLNDSSVISSTVVAIPLKEAYDKTLDDGSVVKDSFTTYIFDALYDHFDPNHSIVSFNEKGNLVMVYHSSRNIKRDKEFVAFMEVTTKGKLVRIDTLCTFRKGTSTYASPIKIKKDGFGNYMVIYQKKGLSNGEDMYTIIKLFDEKTFALKKTLTVTLEHSSTKQLCDEKTFNDSLLYIHVGNVVAIKVSGQLKYFLVLHVNGFSDKSKSRLLVAELTSNL
jgi:hypothetical protein